MHCTPNEEARNECDDICEMATVHDTFMRVIILEAVPERNEVSNQPCIAYIYCYIYACVSSLSPTSIDGSLSALQAIVLIASTRVSNTAHVIHKVKQARRPRNNSSSHEMQQLSDRRTLGA